MCGIIGTVSVLSGAQLRLEIIDLFVQQAYRGQQGFGVGVRTPKGELYRVRATTAKEIFASWIWDEIEEGDVVIFHHRFPTSAPNVAKCNHPISTEDGGVYVAHNGHVQEAQYQHLLWNHLIETMIPSKAPGSAHGVIYTDTELAVHRFEELTIQGKSEREALLALGEENLFSSFFFLTEQTPGILWASHGMDLCSVTLPSGSVYLLSEHVQGADLSSRHGVLTAEGNAVWGQVGKEIVYQSVADAELNWLEALEEEANELAAQLVSNIDATEEDWAMLEQLDAEVEELREKLCLQEAKKRGK